MFNKNNPLLKLELRQRREHQNRLGFDWEMFTEMLEQDGSVNHRKFSELEYPKAKLLKVVPGGPEHHPEQGSYDYHYQVVADLNDHTYTGHKLVANQGEYAEFNNFKGWNYRVNVFNRREYWTDDRVRTIVWYLYSKPSINGTATDVIKTFNAEGREIESTSVSETYSISLNAGRTWGVRWQASTTGTLQIKTSGGTVINSVPRAGTVTVVNPPDTDEVGGNAGGYPGLLIEPNVTVTIPVFARPYFTLVSGEGGAPEPDIRVVQEVRVHFYGQYWLQDIDFENSYEQGWLLHPEGASLATRLKPPGKPNLSTSVETESNLPNNPEDRSGSPRIV